MPSGPWGLGGPALAYATLLVAVTPHDPTARQLLQQLRAPSGISLGPGGCVPAANGLITAGLFVQFDGDPCCRWRKRHISRRCLSFQAHRDDHPAFISQ